MEPVPTVINRKITKKLLEFVKLGYNPVYNWCSPVMVSPFDHESGGFQLIQYAILKDGIVDHQIVWQVYLGSDGDVNEYTKNGV